MASIFTFQDEPPRLHSPWSTPGTTTPLGQGTARANGSEAAAGLQAPTKLRVPRLAPEREDGPVEYKLHLLLSHPTTSGRQLRLRQLTTQLLWRLQQSSPYHSSSTTNLVLPILPDATTTLVVPKQPSGILSGLEESEGALYEIGVADDGTLVGLSSEELQDSLNNLTAMASSLGCVVKILRKVQVGGVVSGRIGLEDTRNCGLWVAEVLVSPDTARPKPSALLGSNTPMAVLSDVPPTGQHPTEQIRVALVGTSTTGKSSLLGCLSTSTLDNGRGKSRLSLLRHRHEMLSGLTSSVAQELVGYRKTSSGCVSVVNYASGDVSSWSDIHNLATRLVFISDSPGLPKFAKSTYRTLISWNPHWTLLCVAADDMGDPGGGTSGTTTTNLNSSIGTNDHDMDLSLAHLRLCLKLGLQIIVVITKMDVATRMGLRSVLSKILSVLKAGDRKPLLLKSEPLRVDQDVLPNLQYSTSPDQEQIRSVLEEIAAEDGPTTTPIIMTSAVSGTGILMLHTLLAKLNNSWLGSAMHNVKIDTDDTALFHIDDVYFIPPSKVYASQGGRAADNHGVVLSGIANETISIGDELVLGPFVVGHDPNEAHPLSGRSLSTSGPQNIRKPSPTELSRSLPTEQNVAASQTRAVYVSVKVVSLRNLRIPVRTMKPGDTGTIGVELIHELAEVASLSRARKGMVLLANEQEHLAFRCFMASFPKADFADSNSPPLILGGNAIAYSNSVRAAVKIVSVRANDEEAVQRQELTSTGLFSFDDADEDTSPGPKSDDATAGDDEEQNPKGQVEITFRFVSTIEWLRVHDQVLVVPTLSAAGPVTGPVPPNSALNGFVGRIREVHS